MQQIMEGLPREDGFAGIGWFCLCEPNRIKVAISYERCIRGKLGLLELTWVLDMTDANNGRRRCCAIDR